MSRAHGIGPCRTAPRALALAGLLLFAATGCGPHIRATIVNESGQRLTELRVSGVQDSTRVPDLAPGASFRLDARVQGEDELLLRGRIGGRLLPPAMPSYVEPGYDVRMTVDSVGWVHVASRAGNGYL